MKKIFGFSGIIGSFIVLFTIIIFSLLHPEYNHMLQTISELNAKGASNAISMNILYTVGFGFLILYSRLFIKHKNYYSFISGLLMLISFLLILGLNWFLPMDATEHIRTLRDQVHNNIITMAVCVFLLSQVFMLVFLYQEKKSYLFNFSCISFTISLIFGILSLWSNLHNSELINIAERGWMLSFLYYISILNLKLK